jgi:hypothetical protein
MILVQESRSIEQIELLWSSCNTHPDTIFDYFNIRKCFFDATTYTPLAYIAYDSSEPVALLALQQHTETKKIEFFGGTFSEHNRVYTKPGYEQCSETLLTHAIQHYPFDLAWTDKDPYTEQYAQYLDDTFFLNIENIHTLKDYIQNYVVASHRSDTRRRQKLAQELQFTVEPGTPQDLETLFSLNQKRFGEESTFAKPARCEAYRRLASAFPKEIRITKISLDSSTYAVMCSIFLNNVWTNLNTGIDMNISKHLSTYSRLIIIEHALQSHATRLDILGGDCGWKTNWGFQKIPQYTYNKTAE